MAYLDENRPTLNIPERADDALSGSAFAAMMADVVGAPREACVLSELLSGNVPSFMRTLRPISVTAGGHVVQYWVTPDYLCIGGDDDYVRFPMTPRTAQLVASAFGACLPTRRMVNAIFDQADSKLIAQTMSASKKMRSTQWLLEHNAKIQKQLEGKCLGELVAGHKKDIVLCRGLWFDKNGNRWGPDHVRRVAIYGWCRVMNRGTWEVWQGLNCSSHDESYEDYSHGARLVSDVVQVDGENYSLSEILVTSTWASFFSDEGNLPDTRYPTV